MNIRGDSISNFYEQQIQAKNKKLEARTKDQKIEKILDKMSISTTKRDLAKLTIKKKSWDTVKDTNVVRDRLASPSEDVKNEIDSLKKLIKLEKSQKTIKDFTILLSLK